MVVPTWQNNGVAAVLAMGTAGNVVVPPDVTTKLTDTMADSGDLATCAGWSLSRLPGPRHLPALEVSRSRALVYTRASCGKGWRDKINRFRRSLQFHKRSRHPPRRPFARLFVALKRSSGLRLLGPLRSVRRIPSRSRIRAVQPRARSRGRIPRRHRRLARVDALQYRRSGTRLFHDLRFRRRISNVRNQDSLQREDCDGRGGC